MNQGKYYPRKVFPADNYLIDKVGLKILKENEMISKY
tara:strand:- start:190 stop:300 length:111 start_codon:yes stop_codon:yes gene_type:complete